MQRIIVKNFGPLKDIDLEIKDYMIFLGPQASGKSTLAKLIYFFREIELLSIAFFLKNFDNLTNQNVINSYNQFFNQRFYQLFGDYTTLEYMVINFQFGNNEIIEKIDIVFDEINQLYLPVIDINTVIQNIGKKLDDTNLSNFKVTSGEKTIIELPKDKNSMTVIAGIFMESIYKQEKSTYFIPSNRAFIAKNYSPASTDVLSKEFYDLVGDIKNNFRKDYLAQIEEKKYFNGEIENITSIDYCLKLINSVLKGSFSVDKNEDKITSIDGHKINLRSAASGQQESIWVMNIIFHLLLENRDIKIIIEEPEAHLFPEAQKDITYLISLLANQEGNQVIITTHSHYILGALNILINAHRIGQTNPEEVEKIVPRELWVDKNRIFAGFLENGIIKDIYDDEAEMIKIQQLNAVAGEINKDFDRLLDLEFANENV